MPGDLDAVRAKVAELRELGKRIAPAPWGINKYGAIGTGEHFIFGGQIIGREGFDEDLAEGVPEWIAAARNSWDAQLDCIEALVEFRSEPVSHSCNIDLLYGVPCTCGYDDQIRRRNRAGAALAAWLEAQG